MPSGAVSPRPHGHGGLPPALWCLKECSRKKKCDVHLARLALGRPNRANQTKTPMALAQTLSRSATAATPSPRAVGIPTSTGMSHDACDSCCGGLWPAILSRQYCRRGHLSAQRARAALGLIRRAIASSSDVNAGHLLKVAARRVAVAVRRHFCPLSEPGSMTRNCQ